MKDLRAFNAAISQIAEEKGIARETILEAIEMAIAAAYKKDYGERGQIVRAKLELNSGDLKLWQVKLVMDETMIKSEEEIEEERRLATESGETLHEEEVPTQRGVEAEEEPRKVRFNPEKHIMLEEARALNPDIQVGEEMTFPLETREEFGRVAAQTAKQVIVQRLREAERDAVYKEFESKTGELASGVVQRLEGPYVFVDVGKTVAIMLPKDQVSRDRYRIGDRVRVFVLGIETGPKGPQVYVSRSHPKLISKLFELEVPEIAAGSVEIKAIAREPGERSKIAVASLEEGVDPIGSCVGQRGTRVNAVIQELGGEKIDIIEWKEEPAEFVAASLAPAKVLDVKLEATHAVATVAEDQLSLAIGKEGQNVRLAAKLTNWRIDIKGKESGEIEESSAEAETETPANNSAEGVAESAEKVPAKEESVQDIAPEAEAEENDKPENSEAAQETPAEEIENTTKEKMKEKPAEETPIEENKSQTKEEIKQD